MWTLSAVAQSCCLTPSLFRQQLITSFGGQIVERRTIIFRICQQITTTGERWNKLAGHRLLTGTQVCQSPGQRHGSTPPHRMQLVALLNRAGTASKTGIAILAVSPNRKRLSVDDLYPPAGDQLEG